MMPMLGLSTGQTIGFTLGAIALVLFVLGLRLASQAAYRRERAERPDIPSAMQPGPVDADLEKPRLEKLQGWALASFLFLAIWIPIVWLNEPTANKHQTGQLTADSIARGARMIQLYSEENILGVGCIRCHGPGLTGGHNLFNNSIVDVPALTHVCAGPNANPALPQPVHNVVDVRNIIMQGIPNTDMPSWSIRFLGGLDDQQIQDLVDYLVSVNEKTVPFKDNVCINPKAKGYEPPVQAAQ